MIVRLTSILSGIVFLAYALQSHSLAVDSPKKIPAVPSEVLVISRVGQAGRRAIPIDPVQAQLISGKWKAPQAGDVVTIGDGRQQRWEKSAFNNGSISGRALFGAYVFFQVESKEQQIVLLDAAGHSRVHVNGEPHTGDVYGTGKVQIPILLRKGKNDFLFQIGRGVLRVKFDEPKSPVSFYAGDLTVPDLIVGEKIDTVAAIIVRNATTETLKGFTLTSKLDDGKTSEIPLPELPPLSIRKIGFPITGPAPTTTTGVSVSLSLKHSMNGKSLLDDTAKIGLRVLSPEQTHRRTFISKIDGSVQYYGLVPAKTSKEKNSRPGLVLTLHGASVEASGQAASYAPKEGLHIVAPTNRRPYGFDWEDWGRMDAIEVLELAQSKLNTDPQQTYLTGHSMGGHGTWHLGVTYPDRFAAIGPSAGWVSMWSYAGAPKLEAPTTVEEIVMRASKGSDTLALARNYSMHGVYILHGDADNNVPVGQARTMRKVLSEFHPDFAYYEEPQAGHWWGKAGISGAACVDWPQMFNFFGSRSLPKQTRIRNVDFRTVNPAVSGWCHWVGIDAQLKSMNLSRIQVQCDSSKREFTGTTENVARIVLNLEHLTTKGPLTIRLDGDSLEKVSWPAAGKHLWLQMIDKHWKVISEPGSEQKTMTRAGPFKEAFRNRMVFVYGTSGTPEENAWSLARARYDAEQFWYRGNGSIDVIADTAFDAEKTKDRNVILYGHSQSNLAWKGLLSASAIQVQRGKIVVGTREIKGNNLASLFIAPRLNSSTALVGVVTGTDVAGLKLTDTIPYFVSGVGLPDWIILDTSTLTKGNTGILGAGYLGLDWKVETGEAAWRP